MDQRGETPFSGHGTRDSQGYEDFLVMCIYILFSFFQVRYILLIKKYGMPIIRKKVKCSDDRVSE